MPPERARVWKKKWTALKGRNWAIWRYVAIVMWSEGSCCFVWTGIFYLSALRLTAECPHGDMPAPLSSQLLCRRHSVQCTQACPHHVEDAPPPTAQCANESHGPEADKCPALQSICLLRQIYLGEKKQFAKNRLQNCSSQTIIPSAWRLWSLFDGNLLSFQKILQEFVNIEMIFHAKALEMYTQCFQNLSDISEEEDLEVCLVCVFSCWRNVRVKSCTVILIPVPTGCFACKIIFLKLIGVHM